MATYTIQQSKTNSKFIVMKDGNAMASCFSYAQAYGVLNRMQFDDAIKSINKKYDRKKRILDIATIIIALISVSVIVAGLILENQ